uniref:Alkaline phosphatase n=1 Tax=Pristhesancus plagipennis TaxID=1955184 RepID=A0A2K8JUQ2_PRIPG|nr:secreted Phosphatase protein [Pristhesancus plagipennis]
MSTLTVHQTLFSFKIFVLLLVTYNASTQDLSSKEYWRKIGRDELAKSLGRETNTNIARNVIVFIGDGMGPFTVTASRIYKFGEAGRLSFEEFPYMGLLKTYAVDKQVPDSASTATAMFCGVKNNYHVLGVDASVRENDCQASLKPQAKLSCVTSWAQEAGKATGFITTTRITHATPAALYANSPQRKWECDSVIPKNSTECKDIARQLIEDLPGRDINLIMGGGAQCMRSNGTAPPEDPWTCSRRDGRDLIGQWIKDRTSRGRKYATPTNTKELLEVDTTLTQDLLGIFAPGFMPYEHVRDRTPTGAPSLEQMATTAVKILNNNNNGFFLMVEGGMIDQAHHRGHARKALHETVALSDAIRGTMSLLDEMKIRDETLVIVTSDHTHSLTITGHAPRGANILGIAMASKADGVPYTSLNYAVSGPNNYHYSSVNNKVVREDPSTVNTLDFEYSQQAAVLSDEGTHGGGDVVVYATGPMAHLFHTVHE